MSSTIEAKMAPIRTTATVVSNLLDGPGRKLRLAVPDWPGAVPGQFVMIGAGAEAAVPRQDPLLPRPMAVYRDFGTSANGEPDASEIELLYRIVGRGTRLLAEAKPGEAIKIVGPLGRGFPLETHPSESAENLAILVGGGTGIASLYELAVALLGLGRSVLVILGARSASDFMASADFNALDAELICTTDDGSEGIAGQVTGPLTDRLDEVGGDATVFAVGPTPMMKACAAIAAERSVRCYVSLENPMACGFGVCLGCAAPRTDGGFSLVCRAGPVFLAGEIDWEGLP